MHTPRPWIKHISEGWGICVKAGNKFICWKLRNEADADLIVAAPDLLEAAQLFIQEMYFYWQSGQPCIPTLATIGRFKDAISKATQEAPNATRS